MSKKFRMVITTVTGREYKSGSHPHEEHVLHPDEVEEAVSDDGAWMTLYDEAGGALHVINNDHVEAVSVERVLSLQVD